MAGGSKSKTKGNSGEREIAKILGGIFDGSFIRSPGSGAFVGGSNSRRKLTLSENQAQNLKGDIVPPDFMPKLILECKSYSEFRFHQLLTPGACPQLDEWIKQTLIVIDPGDLWYIVIKIARRGWFVAAPEGQDYFLNNYAKYTSEYGVFYITDLVEFFTENREIVLKLSA